jgi:glutamyl-tRNA(Gln) amidotransferase subunit D
MTTEPLPGYRGKLKQIILNANVKVGDVVNIYALGQTYEGSLMPRVESADDWHLVLKQKSGYNIGIKLTHDLKITKIGEATRDRKSVV